MVRIIIQQTDAAQQTFYFNNAVVAPTALYQYDALYRLKRADGRELMDLNMPDASGFNQYIGLPDPAANAMRNYRCTFAYDELGNLTHHYNLGVWNLPYVNDTATNRLLRHEGSTNVYTYDEHGNITSMPHLTAMQWDWNDRLRCTTNGTVTTWYCYDAAGNRVRKVTEKPGGIVEDRVYAGIYERYTRKVGSTTHTRRHTFNLSDGQHRYALIDTLTIDNGITLTTPVETVRYQYDNHLGSASLELDEHAAIISYEEYHPFGTTSYRSGRAETEVALKRYKYVGKERDEETGLYYYGARYYAAWLARFVSVDPLQFKYPHYTPYQYAGNNPLFYIDPDGRDIVPWNKTKAYVFTFPSLHILMPLINTQFEGFTNDQGKRFSQHLNEMLKNDGIFKTAYERIEKSELSYEFKALNFGGGVSGTMKKKEHERGLLKDAAGWMDSNHVGSASDPKQIVVDPSKEGHDSKSVIFEEIYHAAQHDYYGSKVPSQLTIEVEAKVAKAIAGFAENKPGLEYEYIFQEHNKAINEKLRSGIELSASEYNAWINSITDFSKKIADIYRCDPRTFEFGRMSYLLNETDKTNREKQYHESMQNQN